MSKSDFSKIKKGERMSFTTYVEVTKVSKTNGLIEVLGADGSEFVVQGKNLIETFNSNTQFQNTEKLGKNALAEKLKSAGDKIFTVNYK